MAYLVNRNPAARFRCLHSLVKFIYANYNTDFSFSLSDCKYNSHSDNVHNYCQLLVDSDFGIKYCPYLQNPLSDAGCNMTNGVDCDSTKSKEVSNTINALHALGFVKRTDRSVKLTNRGVEFANADFGTERMQQIIRDAVLCYGPAVGVLKQIHDMTKVGKTFNTGDIFVGYPDPEEMVMYNRQFVIISAGSQEDSNTRTKSCIIAWLTAGGFIRPDSLKQLGESEYAHSKYEDFLNKPHRGDRKYIYVSEPVFLHSTGFITESPLNYKNLTKMTAALRENNLAEVREATMLYEPVIQNRRLAIVYLLNKAYAANTSIKFTDMVNFLKEHSDDFILDDSRIEEVLQEEIKIAYMCGAPYDILERDQDIYLKPRAGVNNNELTMGAPNDIVETLKLANI